MNSSRLILVTGVTGYVGGRLAPRLLEKGYAVRVLARDRRRLEGRPWLASAEVIEGDVMDPDVLRRAFNGVDTAYYLVHSLGGGRGFHERDMDAARSFGQVAREAGVRRVIYLGGMGDPAHDLSEHLRSRHATGDALRESGPPITEFRAGVIVGSGSLSFEMIRYLTERIPVMICPRWVYTRTQPIAIRNVLEYLAAALETPASADQVIEIGGSDVVSYGDMMKTYAEVRGLRRRMLPVPFLTPRLSSYWVHLVTPIPAAIAQPLVAGLRSEVVVRNDSARKIFPGIEPISYREAVQLALARLEAGEVETVWSDALFSSMRDARPVQLAAQEGMIVERRERKVAATPERVFEIFSCLGGARGWLCWNGAWRLRGALDRMLGGVGMRRGRRDPKSLRVGDAVDFWRVEAVEPHRLIRLRAEMKVPGKAWLQFSVKPADAGRSTVVQTAVFEPKGLSGMLYWYALYPIHALIFGKMIRRLAEESESGSNG